MIGGGRIRSWYSPQSRTIVDAGHGAQHRLDVRFASPPPIPIVAGQGLTTPKGGEGLTKWTS